MTHSKVLKKLESSLGDTIKIHDVTGVREISKRDLSPESSFVGDNGDEKYGVVECRLLFPLKD